MADQYIGVGGIARKVKNEYVGVNGIARKTKAGYVGVDGIARKFYPGGVPLSTFAEGSIVNVNENGVPVEFYIAKHDYESGLNGAGRTLLVRKDIHKRGQAWNMGGPYDGCDMDRWYMCDEYPKLFDSATKNAISTTKIRTVDGVISRSFFALDARELGNSYGAGSLLPTATMLRTVYYNHPADGRIRFSQWTRTNYNQSRKSYCVLADGTFTQIWGNQGGYRPAFTLPSDILVNPDTNIVLG